MICINLLGILSMRILVVGATDEAIDAIKEIVRRGHEVVVLDDNKTRIDKVVQELDVATYIFSIMDLTAFMQAGIHKADMVLAIHPIDTVNVLACVYARHFNVPKVLAVVNTNQVASILEKLGLANNILVKPRAMAKSLTELLYDIKLIEVDSDIYLTMLYVKEGSYVEGKSVEDLEAEGAKVLAIIADNNLVNFDKSYRLKNGEKLIFVVKKDKLESIIFKH